MRLKSPRLKRNPNKGVICQHLLPNRRSGNQLRSLKKRQQNQKRNECPKRIAWSNLLSKNLNNNQRI